VKKYIALALVTFSTILGLTSTPSLAAPKLYNTKLVSKKPVSIVKPYSANYWTINQGFDFSGRLKQVYTGDNIAFEKNVILLEAFNEPTPNPLYQEGIDDERIYTKTANYSGGKITLKEKFLYGHIGFQAKFPNSAGTMPSVWLFDENKEGPNKFYTEVDLLEIPGSEKGNMYSGTHYGIDYQTLKKDFSFRYVPNVASTFHKYDIYKTPTKVVVLVDGVLLKEISTTNKKLSNGINGFNQPMNLIMNMNVGDVWGGEINNTKFPHKLTIKDMIIEKYSY
jgi:Glycosyl hydrolases family 16